MARDLVLAMIKALPAVKEDGDNLIVDDGWEVTLHAGRQGASMTIPQINKIALQDKFLTAETHKGQRVVLLLDEVRGFIAEPSSADRTRGRKTGFM